jgi:hypothetical protein
MLLIDYGLPRHELYHPQRDGGTVRCHYRHRVHDDPLLAAGPVRHHRARRFHRRGRGRLRCRGWTCWATPARPTSCSTAASATAAGRKVGAAELQARARGAVNVLISPNEMGELFKVIALGRGVPGPLLGFARGDRVHAL